VCGHEGRDAEADMGHIQAMTIIIFQIWDGISVREQHNMSLSIQGRLEPAIVTEERPRKSIDSRKK
jgi:hypothetical protein